MSFKEKYSELQNNITPDAEFLEQLAVKMERGKTSGAKDITVIDNQKPLEVVVESRRASIWKLAISAACLVCVLAVGIFAAVKLSGISSGESGSNDPVISDNSFDNSSSSTSDTSRSSENEKIEALIHKYYEKVNGYPYVSGDWLDEMYVSFGFGEEVHIPIPSDGSKYGYSFAYDFLNNSFVIAYALGNTNSIFILSTTDRGKSWQSSKLNLENVDDIANYYYYLAFQNAENGFLTMKSRDDDGGDCMIYTTENLGRTWKQTGSVSDFDVARIHKIGASGDFYWIAGIKEHYPVILKSDDGVNWREVQISIDTAKYASGLCSDVYFSGEMGLAVVWGSTASHDNAYMWFSSEDGGETWSFYKTELIT